jgi:RDD family
MLTDINRTAIIPRALAAIGVMSTVVWVLWFQKGGLGYRAYGRDSVQYVAAGTTPIALVSAVLGICLLFVLMRHELRVGDFQISPLWRRYAALLIDFWFSVYVFASVTTMIPLLFEAARTHSFQWHFERDYWVPSDWAMVVLILAGIGAIATYFVLPLANRRLTVGFWILRIATVSSDGSVVSLPLSTAFRRAYTEFIELFSPFSLWRAVKRKDGKGRTQYDRETGFMVVRYK